MYAALKRFLSPLTRISKYAGMLEAKSIARRMFVTNSFDSLLSALGIILGAFIAGVREPQAYVAAVLGASFTMGFFSGVVATYLSERAERARELKELEKHMLHSLNGSIYEKAAKLVPIYVAFWSGVGAIILPVAAVSPFLLLPATGITSTRIVVYTSVALILVEMFMLGVYLGRIAKENPLYNGLKLLGIGVTATLVLTLLEALT